MDMVQLSNCGSHQNRLYSANIFRRRQMGNDFPADSTSEGTPTINKTFLRTTDWKNRRKEFHSKSRIEHVPTFVRQQPFICRPTRLSDICEQWNRWYSAEKHARNHSSPISGRHEKHFAGRYMDYHISICKAAIEKVISETTVKLSLQSKCGGQKRMRKKQQLFSTLVLQQQSPHVVLISWA